MGNNFSYFFSAIALLVIAIVLIYLRVTKEKITKQQDLRFFAGKLTEHDYYNNNRGGSSCWFKLDNSSNTFSVDGKNLKVFDIDGFQKLIDGDSVKIGLSHTDFSRLNFDEDEIFVFSFESAGNILLRYQDSIKNYQTHFSYYLSSVLLLSSFVLFYRSFFLGKKKSNKSRRLRTT